MLPREHTITGVLATDLALALALGLPAEPWRAALAAAAFLVHLLTFGPLFERASRRRLSAPLLALNAAPYLPAVPNMSPPLLAYLLALAAVVWLAAAGGRIRTPLGYVAGLALYSSLLIPMRSLMGPPAELPALAMYVAYFASMALYVESRLAFRSLDPLVPLALWLPAAAAASASAPLLAAAAVEPTYSLARNVARNEKVKSVEDIRRMGRGILARSLLFSAVLAAAARLGQP